MKAKKFLDSVNEGYKVDDIKDFFRKVKDPSLYSFFAEFQKSVESECGEMIPTEILVKSLKKIM